MSGFFGLPTVDRGFLVLAAAVALLSAISLAFALIALALRFRNDRSQERLSRLTERWEPAMLAVLAGTSTPEALMELVEARDTNEFLDFLSGYARRLRGEERSKVRALAQPYLPQLAEQVGASSAEKRGIAVKALATMGMPEYADSVARALDDSSPVVAMLAARGLFRQGQEAYFPRVMRRLHRFSVWSRSYLSSMLAGGGPATAPLLREILDDPEADSIVRAVAADALRALNDLGSVQVAARLLLDQNDEDRELVAGCIRLLHHLGHREHLELVMPFVTASDPVVRAAAVGAVGALGAKDDVPILQSLLDDEDYWVSLQAARGLMAMGELALLRRLAASTGPWSVLAKQVLTE